MSKEPKLYCKSCGTEGTGNFCNLCGQNYITKRITLNSIFHEVFHYFTHFEKGFGFTLKQLITAPGRTQRAYIEGDRHRQQKPFSMFFICITFCALALYTINTLLIRFYHSGDIYYFIKFFHFQ